MKKRAERSESLITDLDALRASAFALYTELSDLVNTSNIPWLDKRLATVLQWADACEALRDRETELRRRADEFSEAAGGIPSDGDAEWQRRRQELVREATRPAPKAKRRASRPRRS